MNKEGLQHAMFSDQLVDNRTSDQKRRSETLNKPKQTGMFNTHTEVELARTKVTGLPMVNGKGQPLELALMMDDPRSEEEIEADRMKAAQEQTIPLPQTEQPKDFTPIKTPTLATKKPKPKSTEPAKPAKTETGASRPISKVTPVFKQYTDIKKQFPNAIVFFRLGDFYETFNEDAELIAEELDLVLTSRNISKDKRIPMAGVPHHRAEDYIAKLIGKGHHIAIADQIGNEPVNGIIPREVRQVLEPDKNTIPNEVEASPEKPPAKTLPEPPQATSKAQVLKQPSNGKVKETPKIESVQDVKPEALTKPPLGPRGGYTMLLVDGVRMRQPF